jgi:DNA-binding MarR family transcriptional regulator
MVEFIERFEAFTTSVTKAYKSIQKIKLSEAENIGLKANHVMYMHYLGKNEEGLTATELCKLCIEDKAAVSRAIVELTKKGFVKNSEENSTRKYRTKIVLTDEGKQINNNLNEAIAIAVNKASKNLDEVDRENFYRVFFYITDNLDEICSSYLKEK